MLYYHYTSAVVYIDYIYIYIQVYIIYIQHIYKTSTMHRSWSKVIPHDEYDFPHKYK